MNIFKTIYECNKNHPSKLALSVTMDDGSTRAYTYGDVFAKATEYGDRLLSAGVKEGDRVAIACEGSPEWTIAFLAVCKIKCTAALIDASLGSAELKSFIDRSDVRAAFLSPKTFGKFTEFPDYKFPVFNVYDCTVFDGCRNSVEEEPTSDPSPEIATIIYSSGTTRRAAGIMHTHESLIKTTQMTLNVQELVETDRYLAIIPNSHIYGVICLVLGPHMIGADVHYIETLGAEAILKAFKEYKPTVLSAVPKVYELFMTQILRKINDNPATALMFKTFYPICEKSRRKNGKLLGKKIFKSIHDGFGGSLRVLCSAGAPIKKEVADFYYAAGFNIMITYGASETNIPTIGNTPEDITTDTCGVPYPPISLKISDEGEMLIKSPYMMVGYFRDEEATKEAFDKDGWFKTGDLGNIDEQGHVHVTGRLKENIVLATGKKIAPDDIEAKYADLPGVKELVICGVPVKNADYDEVHAFVVPEILSADSFDSIRKEITERGSSLIQNMRVVKTHFVEEIPRTSLQKPKRYLLKKKALEGNDAADEKMIEKKGADIESRVISVIARIANADKNDISLSTKVFSDLAIDSLSSITLALELEDEFKVNIEPYYHDDMTVADIVAALEGNGKQVNSIGKSGVSYPQDKNGGDYAAYSFFKNLAKSFYKINVSGTEHIPQKGGFIICANHVSKIDFLFISLALSKERYMKLCCMAKKELFRNDPFSRKLIKSAGMVPVDRGGMNSSSMENLKKRLEENWGVIIHPEGTRSEDGIFRKIKSGAGALAVETDTPVIPVYIDGAYNIFPKSGKMPKLYDWKHNKKYRLSVTFGKPISPDGLTTEEMTEKIESAISALQKENSTLPQFKNSESD
ncbi:MAG: AMP-binding protein [Ruminococcus sp.]|nr:AMP-binding protein [Ruminococcus sp.]MDY3896090.1 AMP-binding protein [Candidatus Fimenecus sp.]